MMILENKVKKIHIKNNIKIKVWQLSCDGKKLEGLILIYRNRNVGRLAHFKCKLGLCVHCWF